MPAVSPPIAVPAPHTEFSGSQPPGPACSEALWMLDPSGRVVHWSTAAEQLTGYAAAQIVGEPFTRLTRQDEPAAAQRLLDAALVSGRAEASGILTRSGESLAATTAILPLVNRQGQSISFACLTRATPPCPHHSAGRPPSLTGDELFRALVEHGFEGINLLDAEGQVIYSSPGNRRVFGYDADETDGQSGFAFAHPDDVAAAAQAWRSMLEHPQQVFTTRIRVRHKDGSWRWTEATVRNLLHVPAVRGVVVNWRDVTLQHLAETELQRTSDLLRAVADNTTDAVFVKDVGGKYLLFNDAAGRFVDRQPAEVLGHDDTHLFDPASAAAVMARDRQVLESGVVSTAEEQLTAAGVTRVYHSTKSPYRNASGKICGLIGIARDITASKQAEQALRDSEERYRRLVELLPDATYINCQDRIVFCNPAFVRLTGATDEQQVLGRSPFEIFPPNTHELIRDRVRRMMEQGQSVPLVEVELLRVDGSPVAVHVAATPISHHGQPAILVVLHDLTELRRSEDERKRLEEQFRQAQKMEAIGRLAGGVAHDFNNLLTVILGFSDLLLTEHPVDGNSRASLMAIRAAGERAAALTRQLLAFGRKALIEPQLLDLNAAVAQIDNMLRRLIGEDIALRLALAPELPPVRVDPGQIEQVLMNLVVNARDAMPGGGTLTIATEPVVIGTAAVARLALAPGAYVQLTVTDTGQGMDAATQLRIFDPFFTTKDEGRGTGLGLAVVHGIVQQSGGQIDVESQLGRGTTFRVWLPAASDSPAAVPLTGMHAEEPAPDERGNETILLVEDEDAVRTIASLALEARGYRVLAAAGGRQALRLVQSLSPPPNLLVTDVVMPGLGGPQLAASLQADFPNLKVLYLSGYTNDAAVVPGLPSDGAGFLSKPYTARALAHKVREVLGQRHATPTSVP